MIEVSNVQAEVTPLDVEVTASNNVEINTIEDDLDVTITKKEYKIVGDEVYIAKLYDDAPQWMKDLVQLVVNNTVEQSNIQLLNDVIEQLNQFATSYVPLNTYTQQILDLSNADASMHTLIETINSNFNNGLDEANAQIVGLENTKASKNEVIAQVLTTISSELATPTSDLGATIANLQQSIVTGDTANASSIQALSSSLEGEVDARATAINTINTYVGVNEAGASTGTGLSAYLVGSDGKVGSADSQVANGIAVTNGVATSKWAYNSNLIVNGVSYVSGFGLSNSTGTGIGSEFWIDATKLKFTNSATTGRTAPFTIDASGTTPQITFNGKVSFSNVTDVPQLGSTPEEVVNAVNAGNTTTIDGGRITTGSITANQIAANSVTGDNIAANIAIAAPVINGGVINGGVINGVNITGAVIKASWIDYNSTGHLTNWAYFTPSTIPAQYAANFAHNLTDGSLLVDSNGYVRLPKVSKVVIDAYLHRVGAFADNYKYGSFTYNGHDLNVRSYDSYSTSSTNRLLNANTRIVFNKENFTLLGLRGGSGYNGGAVGTCSATWRIGNDVFTYYGLIQATNQGADPHIYTTRLTKNGAALMDVTVTIPSGGSTTSVTYDQTLVSFGMAVKIHAVGTYLVVSIPNANNDLVGYSGLDANISIGTCTAYTSDGLNTGMLCDIPSGVEFY